ncbi:MAG: DNA gyrase inhibitor YacG [Rhizobiaceae bacterium]|nr:DNA gyrase inhibitor YacG [Rhizobiaceae bacterium]
MAVNSKTGAKAANVSPLRKRVPCPHCNAKSARETYPFCSQRCSDLDLGKWLDGSYVIASEDAGSGLAEDEY